MFYSTVGWAVRRPPSLRSIAKYTSHTQYTDSDAAVYADPALKRQWIERNVSPRRQTVRGRKGVDRRGAVWWDAALLVVPSKWIPPWICIGRSHNWIHTDTNRVDVWATLHERKRGTDPSWNVTRELFVELWRPSIGGKRKTGRGVTEFSTASFLCTRSNFV